MGYFVFRMDKNCSKCGQGNTYFHHGMCKACNYERAAGYRKKKRVNDPDFLKNENERKRLWRVANYAQSLQTQRKSNRKYRIKKKLAKEYIFIRELSEKITTLTRLNLFDDVHLICHGMFKRWKIIKLRKNIK